MMKNNNYPLYELEEYESFNQMICRKAEKCKNEAAFQYISGKKLYNVSYQEFLDDILITGNYISNFAECPMHVAILGENSYQWLVTFMAVVMSGNVAVPLDKELDSAGIRELLISSDSTLCIYSDLYGDIVDSIQQEAVKFLSMDSFEQLRKSGIHDGNVQKNNSADYEVLAKWNSTLNIKALAALFFTSGTSGKSKGVMLSQENMMSDINFACKNFSLEGTTLAVLPFHHSFGLLMAVFALFNWEQTIFINSGLKNIKRDMLAARPQTMLLVPLFIETFYRTIWQTAKEQGSERKLRLGIALSNFLLRCGIDVRKKLFRSILDGFGGELAYIICGGAPLQERYVREFRGIGIEILNGYGITECAPVVSTNRNHYHRDGSVGQILKGCDVRIQSDSVHSAAGEIQVKGNNVMLGYYKDEKATEEAFDGGWFRTGDLGFVDPEGFLYVIGRKKNLIILSNGENVSPEELEALLLNIELVKEVMVYDKDGMITAEIFPDFDVAIGAEEAALGTSIADIDMTAISERLQSFINECNRGLPVYKRIQKLKIRQEEFKKTTTQKIKR